MQHNRIEQNFSHPQKASHIMKHIRVLLFGAAALVVAANTEASERQKDAPQAAVRIVEAQTSRPSDFQVYVDRETGFAFIKTPSGWKFIRRIEPERISAVPHEFFVPIDKRGGGLLALGTGY